MNPTMAKYKTLKPMPMEEYERRGADAKQKAAIRRSLRKWSHASKCDKCGVIRDLDDMKRVGHSEICKDCYVK